VVKKFRNCIERLWGTLARTIMSDVGGAPAASEQPGTEAPNENTIAAANPNSFSTQMAFSDSDIDRAHDSAGDCSTELIDDAGEINLAILLGSGIFDESYYRAAAGLSPSDDAARHYLLNGWKSGIEPSANFEGAFLAPYFRAAGFFGAPAIVYAMFRAAGWAAYSNRAQAEWAAEFVRASELFDSAGYRVRLGPNGQNLDPALHYVLVGERSGMPPSARFNPAYYGERYPDIASACACFLVHYIRFGQKEGRRPLPAATDFPEDASRFAPGKETIILISHEASRTGAPIVALNIGQRLCKKYNIVTILLRGGDLVDNFEKISAHLICLVDKHRHQTEFKYVVNSILRSRPVRFAIVNSIASWDFISTLGAAFVPTVTLIHEFASYMRPIGAMREALGWVTEPVFSTKVTAESFSADHPALLHRRVHILPQGQCRLPTAPIAKDLSGERRRLKAAMRPPGAENDFVVLGAGAVQLRKGVDLFLVSAAAVQRHGSDRRVRFVWIGHGYDPENDMAYSAYLAEQIARSHLAGSVTFLDEVTDLAPAYAMADAFYVSSRLDPLPNVAIDAGMLGLPVICFEGATGFAEILQSDKTARQTVMPHLDADAAARLIVDFAGNNTFYKTVREATKARVGATFDMDNYIARIDETGSQAIEAMRQRRADFDTLLNDPSFDTAMSLPPEGFTVARDAAVSRFLAYWSAARIAPHQVDYLDIRRPCAGFNPQIYAHHYPELMQAEINPFADFIRKGRPKGPWLHSIMRPDILRFDAGRNTNGNLRTAIHAHFHYAELIDDFLDKLAVNDARFDLLLSTNNKDKAATLCAATSGFRRGRVEIRVVPNRGRDIAPLMTTYGRTIMRDYDIVGHFHGKRSIGVHPTLGEDWREFLWQHLLGDFYPMVDIVLDRFAKDERLGLIFAEEPHLTDWSDNLALAQKLAVRAGLDQEFPPFFEYPVGTMFWLRARALKPLLDLHLGWDDYPEEPIANDGTILHALERLIPFAAANQGFTWATTHIPGLTW
jgi:glycosyltransferase involved in cell wall biosynthesis